MLAITENFVNVTFLVLLGGMVVLIGIFGLFVVVRVVEPRGLRALTQRFRR